jgi:phosphoglycerol transferase MdoB-like AlkP superfamily enzyme
MKKFYHNLPFYIRFHLFLAILGMTFLSIYRIAFYTIYSYRIDEEGILTVLKAFLLGLRFDFSVVSIFIGISLLYSSIHFLNVKKYFRAVWRIIPVVSLIVLILLLVADIIYYENGNKHIGYEAFAYLGWEMFPLVGSAFAQSPILFSLGVFGILGIIFAIYQVQKKFPYVHTPFNYKIAILQFIVVLVVLVLGIRGGFQTSPLRSSDAIISKETVINDLVLNPGFTAITDLKMTQLDKRHRMKLAISAALVRREVDYPGSEFVSPEYPILRRTTFKTEKPLPNFVVIVLEGWTGKYIDRIGTGKVNNKVLTPFFNDLSHKGLFFNQFIASGGRTTNGLMALIGGIPDRPGLTAVRTPQILNRFSGLGNIGKKLGYETLFVTGTELSFNNKGSIMFHWGFDTLIGKKELEKNSSYKTGPWSYFDEDTYDALHNKILTYPDDKNFIAVIHTGTTHYPYTVPEDSFKIFDASTQDHEYLNVLHYADWALKGFMEKAKTAKYFKNTIFVLVSDHSHHRFLNYFEDRNVPLLFYAPGRIQPELRSEIASQLDVLPTMLGFMEKEIYFSSMGRDLRKTTAKSAYFAYGNIFGWIEDEIMYIQALDYGVGETKTIKAPFIDTKLCHANILLCKKHHELTLAYLNVSNDLLVANKLYPSEAELSEIQLILATLKK